MIVAVALPDPSPPSLSVRLPAGRLIVRAGDVAAVRVHPVRPKLPTDARAVAAAEATTVVQRLAEVGIEVPDPPGRGRTPQVLVEVDVPAGTAVVAECPEAEVVCTGPVGGLEVATSSGSVHAESVLGRLRVRTGRGPVTVHACTGPVELTSSGGVLVLREVAGPATIRNRGGDVHVWWLSASAEVATTTGNVRLGWDPAVPVRLGLSSNVGRVRADVAHRPQAEHEVRVTTVSGDVTVEAAAPPARRP